MSSRLPNKPVYSCAVVNIDFVQVMLPMADAAKLVSLLEKAVTVERDYTGARHNRYQVRGPLKHLGMEVVRSDDIEPAPAAPGGKPTLMLER